MSLMHTFTGRLVDPLDPNPGDIVLEDVAHHLANTCRFNGATPVFYSVAEHACRVAALLEHHWGPVVGLAGLHHDDEEYLLGDHVRPIKGLLKIVTAPLHVAPIDAVGRILRSKILEALGMVRWGMASGVPQRIEQADNAVLAAELRAFWGPSQEAYALDRELQVLRPINLASCMPPHEAKALFLTEHDRLVEAIKLAELEDETGEAGMAHRFEQHEAEEGAQG